jgi:hypothetical protein
MLENNKIAQAVNVSSKEQEPKLIDVFRIGNDRKGYSIWISTYAKEGEERCPRVDFYEDIYDFAYYRMNHSGHFRINIYDVDLDYLQVPYDDLNGTISKVIMSGRTKFVETRNIEVEATETTDGTKSRFMT